MNRQKFHLFASILEYPDSRIFDRVRECLELLGPSSGVTSACLRSFLTLTDRLPDGRIEEVYSGTFDLQVVCYPYVGYQLFGESYKRGAFMVGLKGRYRDLGLTETTELPDHLSPVLRYLAALDDDAECEEFVSVCLIPSLDKMTKGFRDQDNPYREVINALLALLREEYPGTAPETAGTAPAEWYAYDNPEPRAGGSCASCLPFPTTSKEG